MNLKIRLSGDTKDYILYSCNLIHINLIHMKFLLKEKLQRHKVTGGCLRSGIKWRWMADGLLGRLKCLKLDCGDILLW